jgi:hypothetical protein
MDLNVFILPYSFLLFLFIYSFGLLFLLCRSYIMFLYDILSFPCKARKHKLRRCRFKSFTSLLKIIKAGFVLGKNIFTAGIADFHRFSNHEDTKSREDL